MGASSTGGAQVVDGEVGDAKLRSVMDVVAVFLGEATGRPDGVAMIASVDFAPIVENDLVDLVWHGGEGSGQLAEGASSGSLDVGERGGWILFDSLEKGFPMRIVAKSLGSSIMKVGP